MKIRSINPATEAVLATFESHSREQMHAAVAEAQAAFETWRERTFDQRAVPMRALAAVLRERADHYARLITLEMGKPISESLAELEKCARNCDFYAEHAQRFLANETAETNARESFVAFEPLGLVLAVMPWNFPFWQVIRFAAPALMAGNGAILKHASNVPQTALAIEEAVRDAGFPAGLLRTVLVAGGDVEPLIADERIRAVTLTGSSDTGSRIAELAGRALKKAVLELGGSDPFIVLADADLDGAARTAAKSRYLTPVSRASPRSASSWRSPSRRSSSAASPPRSPRSGSGTRSIGRRRSAHWRARTCAMHWTSRSPSRWPWARAWWSAARDARARAGSTSRRCSPT